MTNIPAPSFLLDSTTSIRLPYQGCLGPFLSSEDMQVSIWGRSHRVDLDEKKLTIEWEVVCEPFSGEELSPAREDGGSGEPPDYAADASYIVDVYLTDASGRVLSYDPAELMGYNRFGTEHDLHALGQFPVPFDSYTFQAYAFAINPVTNQSIDIAVTLVSDPPDGFAVSSGDAGVANDTNNGPNMGGIRPRVLTIAIRYSTFTLALTTCMLVANWILTFGSVYTTFSAMTKGRVTWSAFVLQSTMVLVIPSIRKLYLCPPPFGPLLDTAGFFSQIFILTFCSVILLHTLVESSGMEGHPLRTVQKASRGPASWHIQHKSLT